MLEIKNLHVNVDGREILKGLDLELPKGATLVTPGEMLIVQCVEAQVEEEMEPSLADAAEPEVIGGRKDEDGEEGQS